MLWAPRPMYQSMAPTWPLCYFIAFANAVCVHALGLACPNLAEHNSLFNYTFSGNGSTAPLCTYLTQLPIQYILRAVWYSCVWLCSGLEFQFLYVLLFFAVVLYMYCEWPCCQMVHYRAFCYSLTIYYIVQHNNTIPQPYPYFIYVCNVGTSS